MKRILATLILALILSSSIVSAVNLEGDISVTDELFSGTGEITSFDANSRGDVLICVNKAHSFERYVMVFQPDGTLLRTYEMYYINILYAMFTEDDNIVLYGSRSSTATVMNEQGDILYEYDENYADEIYDAETPSNRYYGNICYTRNLGKNRITKRSDEGSEVFYETKSASFEFLVIWCIVMLFILGAGVSLRIKLKKGIPQNDEDRYFKKEEKIE